MRRGILLLVGLLLSGAVSAAWVQGTGQAVIVNGDMNAAREEARNAALRDASLQYEAQVSSQDTMENGVLTDSRLTVASRAQARQVRIIEEQRRGNLLRLTVEADMSRGQQCAARDAARLRKRVAITGFPMLNPGDARMGRISDAGEVLPQQLLGRLQGDGAVQVFGATQVQLFPDIGNAPTQQRFDNSLTNVIQLAKELDVQFVVTGVIRDMSLADPTAWGTSILDRMSRGLGLKNQERQFVADLMVYDGFSGSPVYQKRFVTSGTWNEDMTASVGFGSPAFNDTDYGKAVSKVMGDMEQAVNQALACQPFITRISRVDGQQVYLRSGATAGLRPGDKLQLYRSYQFFDSPGTTPELRDAEVTMTVNHVHPDFSSGLMPEQGGIKNLQRDDIAIIW